MSWEQGRQKSGYIKKKLFIIKWLSIDAYLIKYPIGSSISKHIDKLSDKKHYRLNIVLRQPKHSGNYNGNSFLNIRNELLPLKSKDL